MRRAPSVAAMTRTTDPTSRTPLRVPAVTGRAAHAPASSAGIPVARAVTVPRVAASPVAVLRDCRCPA